MAEPVKQHPSLCACCPSQPFTPDCLQWLTSTHLTVSATRVDEFPDAVGLFCERQRVDVLRVRNDRKLRMRDDVSSLVRPLRTQTQLSRRFFA